MNDCLFFEVLPLVGQQNEVVCEIMVKFSLGTREDFGLDEDSSIAENASMADVDHSPLVDRETDIPDTIIELPRIQPSSVNSDLQSPPSVMKNNKSPDSLFRTLPKNEKSSSIGASIYKLYLKVISIGLVGNNNDKRPKCTVKCIDSPFQHIDLVAEGFQIITSLSLDRLKFSQVPSLCCDITFKADTIKLTKVFSKKSIKFQIILNDSIVGIAQIPLMPCISNPGIAPSSQVNIDSKFGDKIGALNYLCMLTESSDINRNLTVGEPVNLPSKRPTSPHIDRASDEELEKWKQLEKKRFRNQVSTGLLIIRSQF